MGERTQDSTDLNVVLGGLVGAVAAACVGLLLFYMTKHPKQAKKACRPSATWPHVLLCEYPSVYPPAYSPIYPPAHLPTCPPVSLPTCPQIYPEVV